MTDHQPGYLSRRDLLRFGGATLAAGALLPGCSLLPGDDAEPERSTNTRSFNPIPKENRKQGTTAWQQSGEHDGGISGFVNRTTLRQGDDLELFVRTVDPTWRAEVYRMGWYGGRGARLMHVEEDLKGRLQEVPDPNRYPELMIEADWKPSLKLHTSSKWTTGVYLVKLRSSSGSENYVPFIVRDDRASSIFYSLPVTTWLAYNVWGGRGIYKCIYGKGAGDWDARSRLVSFDRPYSQEDKGTQSGADRFFNFDYSMVRFLERRGFDVTYGTNIDVHARPRLLLQHDLFLSAGHDEYWTKEMRDHLEMIRDSGVNLAFLGANDGYRAVRLEDSPLGPHRRMRHYKEYTEDPLLGKEDDRVAAQWRFGPTNRPENELIGIMYAGDPVDDPWICTRTDHWLFEGTGLKKGYEIPHMVGHEYDRAFTEGTFSDTTPEGLEILSVSPVAIRDEAGKVALRDESNSSLYIAESGAGVFAAGTVRWNWFLDDFGGSYYETKIDRADKHIQKLTEHLFTAMGDGPLQTYVDKL